MHPAQLTLSVFPMMKNDGVRPGATTLFSGTIYWTGQSSKPRQGESCSRHGGNLMRKVSSGILRRNIGRRFAALRQRAGFTYAQAAVAIHKGRTTIQRIETGDDQVRYRNVDVAWMCNAYGATDEERELLLALTAQTSTPRTRSWWTCAAMPRWFRLCTLFEDAADAIRGYEAELVPGLLQTPDYATAVFRAAAARPPDQRHLTMLTSARAARQRVLARADDPPRLSVILNESVIRRPVGGPAVMAAQLRHLVAVGRRDNITVRVLPFAAGGHAAMGTSFYLYDFPAGPGGEPLEPATVYTDNATGATYLNDAKTVGVYRHLWRDLSARALDEPTTRTFITTAMEEYASADWDGWKE
jgi:transcriptional regulator with XRE-family HTH domain